MQLDLRRIAHRDDELVNGLGFDPDGHGLVVALDDRLLAFDLHDGSLTQTYALEECGGACVLLRYTPDRRRLVAVWCCGSGSDQWTFARIFDAATGRRVAAPEVPETHGTPGALFDPAGEKLVIASEHLLAYEIASGRLLATADGEATFFDIAWDPVSANIVVVAEADQGTPELREYQPDTLVLVRSVAVTGAMPIGVSHPRAKAALAPKIVTLPGLEPVELPSGATAWMDFVGTMTWLAADAATAILWSEEGVEIARADGRSGPLVASAGEWDPWHVAVSNDGAHLAWADGMVVHVEAVASLEEKEIVVRRS